MRALARGLVAMAAALATAAGVASAARQAEAVEGRFREAGEALRSGHYLRGIALYRELAASGVESASLYWNWAQAASARGATGEALWALARARELEPGDAAVGREIERVRQAANLDPAEIAPEPLAALGRFSHRFRLGLGAILFLVLSLALHAAVRLLPGRGRVAPAAWLATALGLCLAAVPLIASLAKPTGVVLRRGAPLLESASPTAEAIGALREGEVVPVLAESGPYLRVQDSSGARGWAHASDVGRLDRPPAITAASAGEGREPVS